MLTLLLLAAVTAPADITPPADAADIVVVARRFDETHGKLTRSLFSKTFTCTVSKTSGDTKIDDAVCKIAITCVNQNAKRPAFLQCVAAGRQAFLDTYRDDERDEHAQN